MLSLESAGPQRSGHMLLMPGRSMLASSWIPNPDAVPDYPEASLLESSRAGDKLALALPLQVHHHHVKDGTCVIQIIINNTNVVKKLIYLD